MNTRFILYIYILLVFAFFPKNGISQVNHWVVSGGGLTADNSRAVYVQENGDVIIGGYFEAPAKFEDTLLSPPPYNGNYLASYSQDGKLNWTQILDTRYGDILKVKGDKKNNTYILGSFNTDTARFGDIEIVQKKDIGTTYAYYLTKLTANGTFEWVKTFSEDDFSNQIHDLYVDTLGNSYLSGSFLDSIQFGSKKLKGVGTDNKIFLAKIDYTGTVKWARELGETGSFSTFNTSLSGMGDRLVLTGFLFGESNIGSDNLNNIPFLSAIDSEGNVINTIPEGGIDVECDHLGNTYLIKNDSLYKYNATFQKIYERATIELAGYINVNKAGDVFVARKEVYSKDSTKTILAKHGNEGNIEWKSGAMGQMDIAGASSDTSGNVYLAGSFMSGKAYFGNHEVTNGGRFEYLKDFFLTKVGAPLIEGIALEGVSATVPITSLSHGDVVNMANIKNGYLKASGNPGRSNIEWYLNDRLVYTEIPDVACENCRTSGMENFSLPKIVGSYKIAAKPYVISEGKRINGKVHTIDLKIVNDLTDVIEGVSFTNERLEKLDLKNGLELKREDLDSINYISVHTNILPQGGLILTVEGQEIVIDSIAKAKFFDGNSLINIPISFIKDKTYYAISVVPMKKLDNEIIMGESYSTSISLVDPGSVITANDLADIKGSNNAYPNPFNDELHIQFKGEGQSLNATLVDLSGRVQFSTSLKGNSLLHIPVADLNLASGIYFLKMVDEKGTIVVNERVVKQ